jgi:hypothetical protein
LVSLLLQLYHQICVTIMQHEPHTQPVSKTTIAVIGGKHAAQCSRVVSYSSSVVLLHHVQSFKRIQRAFWHKLIYPGSTPVGNATLVVANVYQTLPHKLPLPHTTAFACLAETAET